MYGEKMSRGEFLRRVLGMGGIATAALFLLAACGGEDDDEEEEEDD